MAIEPHCFRCLRPLTEPGALAFSPPRDPPQGDPHLSGRSFDVTDKYHFCVGCWEWILAMIKTLEDRFDCVRHVHSGKRFDLTHTHAWGSVQHGHLMRSICLRDECKGFPTHDIHAGP